MMRINILLVVVLCCGIGILDALDFSKWIVVTTIQYPTPQLKKLAQLEGWHLLVVGDKKTPSDWQLENAEYLSPEKQLSLGYTLAPLLPWNHYSRKNIGYLYAIEHGAQIIYDTDDDNEPIAGLNPQERETNISYLETHEIVFNMYAYFGKDTMWPRGYPLEKIQPSMDFVLSDTKPITIGIEQGLVNEDPDVDAIFRLTQCSREGIFFEAQLPCALKPGVFCPTNSQNTFIHKDAFFTLYLPSTISMRVSDIWRSYVAQRLLLDISLGIIFSGPSAIQKRNEHNLMHDFLLEQDLYHKAMPFVTFLTKWENSFPENPLKAFLSLLHGVVEKGFLKERELELAQAWVEDLNKVECNYLPLCTLASI